MYERILFDIDGTIVDSEQAVRRALAKLMKIELGVTKKPEEIAFYYGIPGIDSLRLLGFPEPEKSNQKWSELTMSEYNDVELFADMENTLRSLRKKGYRLGIVTSKTRQEYINEFQYKFLLDDIFEDKVLFEDTVEHKPNPAPILEYLRRNQGDPSKTLYIGDTLHDFNCADQAGVDFALAVWGNSYGVIQARYQPKIPSDILKFL